MNEMYTLLIVDDEEIMLKGLMRYVNWEEMGFSVTAVLTDSRQAMEILESSAPDILLTDIRMTPYSGIDLARFIHEEKPQTKVVFLSAYQDFQYARTALALKVEDYLVKPIIPSEIRRFFLDLKEEMDRGRAKEEPDEPLPSYSRPVRRAMSYIRENLNGEITLEIVADYVKLTPAYLSRAFKSETGENYIDFLRTARIEQAKKLLLSDDPIKAVASRVGYQDIKHFYKTFKKVTGLTPGEFRNQN